MHTILVADDSVTIQKAVEIVFDKEPFTVVKAGSGGEALQRAREAQVHLVLVDHTLGDRTGYEVAEALHADPATSQIPILILTTQAVPFDENRARAAGVLGHLPKPFDCTTLLDRVKSILGVTASGPVAGAAPPTPAAVAATPRPPGIPSFGASRPAVAAPSGAPVAAPAPGLPRPPSFGSTPGVGAPAQAATPAYAAQPAAAPAAASYVAPSYSAPSYGAAAHDAQPAAFSSSFATPAAAPRPAVASPSLTPAAATHNPFGPSSFGATPVAAASQPLARALTPMPTQQPPIARAPTPMPSRGADPFGFGASLSQPPAAAANPFATAPAIAPVPAASIPPITRAAPEAEFEVSLEDISPPQAAAPPTPEPTGVTSLTEVEFMEVSDADLAPVATPAVSAPAIAAIAPSSAALTDESKSTSRVDTARLVELDRQADLAQSATAKVIERAAPALAATNAGAPSSEALSAEARAIVERIAWEVVPELAETIIREEIRRLLQPK
jgi:CheY-like chemotaxis protein